jgi:hypothetical protein
MKIEIKHRFENRTLYSCELPDGTANPVREADPRAVAGS